MRISAAASFIASSAGFETAAAEHHGAKTVAFGNHIAELGRATILQSAHVTLAAASTTALSPQPMPEITSGRSAAFSFSAIAPANACAASDKPGTCGAVGSSACAIAKPRRASSSGGPRKVRVAISSSLVSATVAINNGPALPASPRALHDHSRAEYPFFSPSFPVAGAQPAAEPARAAARYWPHPHPIPAPHPPTPLHATMGSGRAFF